MDGVSVFETLIFTRQNSALAFYCGLSKLGRMNELTASENNPVAEFECAKRRTGGDWKPGMAAAGFSIAAWLLLGYVMPNSPVVKFSARTFLRALERSDNIELSLLTAGPICAVVLGILLHRARKCAVRFMLGGLAGVQLILYLAVAVAHRHEASDVTWRCTLALGSTGVGAVAATLCGSGRRVAVLLSGCLLLMSVHALALRVGGHDRFYSGSILRLGGAWGDPSILYLAISPLLSVALGLAMGLRGPGRGAALAVAGVGYLILLGTWHRAGLAAVSLACSWLLWRTTSRRIALSAAMALCGMTILAATVRSWGPVNARSAQRSAESRYDLWRQAARIWWETPVTGAGVATTKLHGYRFQHGARVSVPQYHPHNLLLYVTSEQGLVGIWCFLSLVFIVIRMGLRTTNPVTGGFAASWMTWLIIGLFDVPFGLGLRDYLEVNALFGAVLGGTMLSEGYGNGQGQSLHPQPSPVCSISPKPYQ